MRTASPRRGGFAMLLALVFLVLFLSLWSLAYRQVASVLRIETARSTRIRRDEGCTRAVARGLALLETGYPPTTPYSCGVTLTTSAGARDFTVTFTLEGGSNWSVAATPGTSTIPMPAQFTQTAPPSP
jgi:hypothetical protein